MTQFKYMENVTDRSNHGELLAPNGKPSNLSPELYAYVRTPEFKEFFGDWEKGKGIGHSCVLDGNGEPLVLYRGQWSHEDKPFVNYGDGIYFTPQREAAIGYGLDNDPIPTFVNARKPCKVDFEGDSDIVSNDLHADVKSEYRYAAKEGYDILIATNTHDGENYLDQYVVVDNSQIRRIDTLDLEAILSRNVSFYNQSIHMNDSNSNDLGSDGKEFYLKAERELKKFIGEEGIDFKQRLGMPLCIVNDSFGSDSKYVKPQDAYINEIGFRDGKLSVKGNIDDDGVPVKVNGLQDLGRQGIKNLIGEVREMHEAQRLSDSLKDVVSELKDTNLLNEPIELKHPVQFAYMNASHVKVVENLSVASVESAESIMLYNNSRDAMGGFNPYFLSDLDRGKIYQVIDDLKEAAASRRNALSDIKSLSEEERAGLIDFYLSGDMPKKDCIAFEKAMEKNPELKEEVLSYAAIIHVIKDEGLRAENNRLQAIINEAKSLEKENLVNINNVKQNVSNPMSHKDDQSVGEAVNAVQQAEKATSEKKAANKEFIQVLSLDLDDINLRLSKDPMKNNILESLKYKIFFKGDATSVDDVIKAKRQGEKYEMKIAEDYGWNFNRLDGPLFLISNIKNKPVQTLHISVEGQNISLDRHIQTAIWQKNITQPIASFELKEFNNQNSLDNQKNKQEYVVWLSGNPNTLSGMGDVLNFDKKEDVYKRLMVYDYKTEWSGTKDDIIKDAGKTYFIYEHVSPAEHVKDEISRTIRKSLVDLAKENGVINEEDIKLMNQIASKKEGINNANEPKINPSFNKEDKNMSKEKDQQSVGEVVNAVQEEKKAQPEKKATNNEIGKEAKSIIHLDTIAEKVRGKNENPDQSVVIVRSRDVASKANVYQAFGEDAARLASQSKSVELNTPAINGKQYSVAKFPEESAKSVAKDLAAANVSVNLVNGRGESIPNDKAFSQATSVKEASKEAQKEVASPKQAASNANSERINDAVSKAYDVRLEAFNQAKQSAKENSVVLVEIKQPKEDKSYFQSFGKDAQTIAALLNKEVKNTPQNVNYVSLNKNDLDKLTPLLEKDGMKAVKVSVNDNLKETVKEIANPSKSVAIAENSKVQYEIGKNMHAQGIYDIKLYVDEKKVAAHHITKEDRNAFFNKEVTAKDLVAKYFSKELNGATPEVSRFQKADLTTVNNQSVTNAHVFKSEKGNLFFSANLDGKPLSPQFITEEKAKGFKEGKISLEEMMKAAYPTKMAPKLSDEQFNSPAISDGRKIDYFRIAKEQDQSKADYGKYKLSAGVDGQHFKSGALPLKDLNEYFDKVASKATLVERRFGEALQLKSAFEKYRLPDGLKMGENASFNIEKDNAQRRYFISGELKGSSLERKELSFNDAKAYWKHSATEEQLGAKYYPKEIKAAVKVKDVELTKEREYSLKR